MSKDRFGKLLRGSAKLDDGSDLYHQFGSVPSNDSQVVGFSHGRTITTCCMLAKPKINPTKLSLCHGRGISRFKTGGKYGRVAESHE